MKEYAPGSISWQISNVLRERYPDGVAETGAWTQIAGEFGATRGAAGLPSYKTGMTFCSTQCSWRYRGKHYGWGNPDHPNNAHRGEHGRVTQYQQGCRCDACKAASREYYGNKYKENPEYREKVLARGRAYYARKKAERAAART